MRRPGSEMLGKGGRQGRIETLPLLLLHRLLLFLLLVFFCLSVGNVSAAINHQTLCGEAEHTHRYYMRIIGGRSVVEGEWPWQVALQQTNPYSGKRLGQHCGGTLIHPSWVLTAAHCIDGTVLPRNALPTVVLGEHQRSVPDETPFTWVVRVARVITHEGYDGAGNSKNNDIGLVELAAPLDLGRSPGIAPACPPAPNTTDAAQRVTTLGWGFTSVSGEQADVLQMVELLPVPLTKCRDQYEAGIITENMICAAATNKDSCFDDSGGPLMTEVEGGHWELIGVVSFGPSVCAQQGVAGVYTRVVNYLPWISSKIGLPTTCPAV